MIKYKHQLLFLLIACLNCIGISSATADTQTTATKQGSVGSAATGYDYSTFGSNPDSDTSNAAVYQGERGYPGMLPNRDPNLADEYARNTPGPQTYPSNTYILPAQNLPDKFRAQHYFALPNTSTRLLTPVDPKIPVNSAGLPPTTLDSFVSEANAIGQAEAIYGDEGSIYIPPDSNFDATHRIARGFDKTTEHGLTTGHGSFLPSAWGYDGVRNPGEWSKSAHPTKPSLATSTADSTDVNEPAVSVPTN